MCFMLIGDDSQLWFQPFFVLYIISIEIYIAHNDSLVSGFHLFYSTFTSFEASTANFETIEIGRANASVRMQTRNIYDPSCGYYFRPFRIRCRFVYCHEL